MGRKCIPRPVRHRLLTVLSRTSEPVSAWHDSHDTAFIAPNVTEAAAMTYVLPVPHPPAVRVNDGSANNLFPVRRIYCVGRNYAEHAIEMGFTGREPPFFFLKPADAVLAVAEGSVG